MNVNNQHRTIELSLPGYNKDFIEKYKPDKQYTTPHDDKLFNRPVAQQGLSTIPLQQDAQRVHATSSAC